MLQYFNKHNLCRTTENLKSEIENCLLLLISMIYVLFYRSMKHTHQQIKNHVDALSSFWVMGRYCIKNGPFLIYMKIRLLKNVVCSVGFYGCIWDSNVNKFEDLMEQPNIFLVTRLSALSCAAAALFLETHCNYTCECFILVSSEMHNQIRIIALFL